MRRARCPRLALFLVACVLPAGACGTTVDDAGLRSGDHGMGIVELDGASGTGEGGTVDEAAAADGGRSTSASGRRRTASSGTESTGTTLETGGGGGGGGGGGVGGRPPAAQAGVTATEIRIGVPIIDDVGTLGTFGFGDAVPAVTAEDVERAVRAVLNELNAHGGAAGRKLVPVFQHISLFSGTHSQHGQEMCEHFTSDNKVFAVVMAAMNNELTLLPNCLARNKTVMVDGSNSVYFDDKEIEPFASVYYRPGALAMRKYGAYVDGLVAQGFLTKSNRIGLLRFDTPQHERTAENVVDPAMARHGLAFADEFAFTWTDDFSKTSSEAGNAAVLFNGQDIDRVVFLASNGSIPLAFLPAAEGQGYRPRYGFSSADSPYFLANSMPETQMEQARVVGWNRQKDTHPSTTFDDVPTWQWCAAIMKKAGFEPAGDLAWGLFCDLFLFLDTALDRVSEVSPAGFRAAVDGLGADLQLAEPYSTGFAPQEAMAAVAVRYLVFEAACLCFRFASPPHAVD